MSASDDPRPHAPVRSWSPDPAAYLRWIREIEQPRAQTLARRWQDESRPGSESPRFSIVLPVYRPPLELLRQALDSVVAQHYPLWELCIADDGSGDAALEKTLRERAQNDSRLRLELCATNGGIAAATNAAIALARGDFIVFLDQDDLLPPHALLSLADAVAVRPELALLYTDCDRLAADGTRIEPYFKPGWDPELLLAQNYPNHLTAMRRSLVLALGGLRCGFDGAQDHDLLLRAAARLHAAEVTHVPEILYHWRKLDTSISATRLGSAVQAARAAVRDQLAARGIEATVVPAPGAALFSRVCRTLDPAVRIVVIVHGADASVRQASRAAIGASRAQLIEAVPETGEAAIDTLERVIEACDQDVLVLLQAGWSPCDAQWLEALAAQVLQPDVGLAGPRLVAAHGEQGPRPPGRLWMDRWIVDTFPRAAPADDRGYHATALLDRRVSILHGACLALRRSTWQRLGSLDRQLQAASTVGADLSLRCAQLGLQLLWCPATILRETGDAGADAEPDAAERAWFRRKWAGALVQDPYFNPQLAHFLQCADNSAEQARETRHAQLSGPAPPRIAVIVVNYNGAEFLDECLQSLARQTSAPDRIIVIDNASTDGSAAIAAGRAAVELVCAENNGGFATACNRGIVQAGDCDWILSLNPDTVADERLIERARDAIATHAGYDSFACCMLDLGDPSRMDGAGDAYHLSGLAWRRFHGVPRESRAQHAAEVFSACAAAALYRREAVCAAGGFDEQLFCYLEDVDLGFRLQLRGSRCLYLPQCVVRHAGSGIVGRRSAFQVYYGQRNLVWVFAKNMPAPLVWLLLPVHLAMNLVVLLVLCMRGTALAALRAKRDALLGLPRVLRERRRVQRTRTRTVREIWVLLDKGPWRTRYRARAVRELA